MLRRYNINSDLARPAQMCPYAAGQEKKIAFTVPRDGGIFLVDDQVVPSIEQYLSGMPGECRG
jgi:hypothetical protein